MNSGIKVIKTSPERRKAMLDVELFYQGKNFSVFTLSKDRVNLLPRVTVDTSVVKWEPGFEFPPNCIDEEDNLMYSSWVKTPENVLYADALNEQEWYPIQPTLGWRDVALRKPVPLVFCLKRGTFVLPVRDIYLPVNPEEKVTFSYASKAVLAGLDRWGLTPARLTIENSSRVSGYLPEGIPVCLALENGLLRQKVWEWSNLPFPTKLENSTPLFFRQSHSEKLWLFLRDGSIWTYPKPIQFSPEEAEKVFSLKTNQPLVIQNFIRDLIIDPKLSIDLSLVEQVVAPSPISILTNGYSDKFYLKWGIEKEGKITTSLTYIRLKKPFILQEKNFGFIGTLEDLQKFLENDNIVKLKKGLSAAGNSWFYLYYIENGIVNFLPGRYAYHKLIQPSLIQRKKELEAEYKTALEKLTYKLPGDPLDWEIEDHILYNKLLQSKDYSNEPIILIGSYPYSPNYRPLVDMFRSIKGGVYTFLQRPRNRVKRNSLKEVKLYKKITILEALQVMKQKEHPYLDSYNFMRTYCYLLQHGFPEEFQSEILNKIFLNKAKFAAKPNKHDLESLVIDLASLGVNDEVLIEILSICLELSQIDTILAKKIWKILNEKQPSLY